MIRSMPESRETKASLKKVCLGVGSGEEEVALLYFLPIPYASFTFINGLSWSMKIFISFMHRSIFLDIIVWLNKCCSPFSPECREYELFLSNWRYGWQSCCHFDNIYLKWELTFLLLLNKWKKEVSISKFSPEGNMFILRKKAEFTDFQICSYFL